MPDENLAIELAQLREQMKSMAASVEEIRISVTQIMTLDKTIGEIGVRNAHVDKELSTMWKRIDEHRTWVQDHDAQALNQRQTIQQEVTRVEGKFDAVVNRGRGALWLAGISFTFVNGCIAAAVLWTFNHVSEGDRVNSVQQYRIEQLEKKVNQAPGSTS